MRETIEAARRRRARPAGRSVLSARIRPTRGRGGYVREGFGNIVLWVRTWPNDRRSRSSEGRRLSVARASASAQWEAAA